MDDVSMAKGCCRPSCFMAFWHISGQTNDFDVPIIINPFGTNATLHKVRFSRNRISH